MNNETLTDFAIEYHKSSSQKLKKKLDYYRSLKSIEVVISNAAMAKGPNVQKDKHQHRLSQEVLEGTTANLLKNRNKVLRATSFQELMKVVEQSKVNGFGPLAIYDTSLRIGAWRGILPEFVYLHAGTKKGARVLGLNTQKRYLRIGELPEPLRRMKPYHIENFLCIFKDNFNGKQGRIAECNEIKKGNRLISC